jgi:hypothetical protein
VWSCVVVLKEDFSNIFVRSKYLQKGLCKVLRVWMYRRKLKGWPRGIRSTKITPSTSQENSGHDFPCWKGSPTSSEKIWMVSFDWLLSAVQNDGYIFHPQWRSVTKNFHHRPPKGRANLNTRVKWRDKCLWKLN